MNYKIREMRKDEYQYLDDFLYEAIFQREGDDPVPREIILNPKLQVYIKDFGMLPDDYCLCTEIDNRLVGAVWVRNIAGYGSVDDGTPEFAISLYKEYRGYGIGSELMHKMLQLLRSKCYRKVSLAVQKDNYALSMYKKAGFQIIDENAEEFIMEYIFM
ncbi:GNAT family N-acetyltransferase [Faecalicatena orotica]|uniref:Acetyltransferase (GNAT) family protein n=1 Tax=Faecalicatena orotica TaxID=1544 RepID=A0A2Y9C679_9FIRM|nr:GNAT family N-acetyltransferase [Faecalicatena orotica]PWJ23387.1 acetyltransferase (GNAT) family protein [Faecalicatena orotica]SSA57645.1 Acetyltransferase (GNAT) domain-containing protein [Faecalicatena orotica]